MTQQGDVAWIDPAWRAILNYNGIDERAAGFAALWQREAGWFEAPNRRRSGWSGVSRLNLSLPDGGAAGVFLKRQENHNTFSWRHPLRGMPTFIREFRHIRHYRACQVATLEPLYFAARVVDGQSRAILMTAELAGFQPLDVWNAMPRPRAERCACLAAVAALLRQMHTHRIQHNCCFPKHLFVHAEADGTVAARIIDLEKSRWRPFAVLCSLRDLDTLNRHAAGWSRSERLRFLKAYLNIPGAVRLTSYGRWLWRRLVVRMARKQRARRPS